MCCLGENALANRPAGAAMASLILRKTAWIPVPPPRIGRRIIAIFIKNDAAIALPSRSIVDLALFIVPPKGSLNFACPFLPEAPSRNGRDTKNSTHRNHAAPFSSASAFSKLAASSTFSDFSSGSICLSRPQSTLPGPASTKRFAPAPLSACSQSIQRTAPVT